MRCCTAPRSSFALSSSLYVAFAMTFLGCGRGETSPPAESSAAGMTDVAAADGTPLVQPMLPAYPLPGERGSDKADQYSDYKDANPGVYGITSAPKTPMRAVAQYDDHEALLLTWTGNFPDVFAAMVKASKPVIDIYVVHNGSSMKTSFTEAMNAYGVSTTGLNFLNLPNDSIWMRDYGPLSARTPDGTVAIIDPRYYDQRVYDDAIPTKLASTFGLNTFRQPLKWEGGTFMADGRGNCFHSQGVYWYGGTSEAKVQQYLRDYLGCETTTVLYPLEEEGTTHSDMFAKLLPGNKMLLGDYTSSQDAENAAILDANAEILEAATMNDGSKLQVIRIPMPSNSNRQVWRTYTNSLFVNGVNLIPVYTDNTTYESQALEIWKSAMPDWQHVTIDSSELITWSGAIHCITMTIPKGQFAKSEPAPTNLCGGAFTCFPTATGAETCSLVFEGCCSGDNVTLCGDAGPVATSCGGFGCGYSDATMAYACSASSPGPANAPQICGAACVPNCEGKACGPNGCGGSCGTCAEGFSCSGNQCKAPDDPCGGIEYEGCCDGKTLKWCEQGQVQTQSCQQICGWNSGQGFYDCGWNGSDPSGSFAKACPTQCQPNCDGKTCGEDGCGGSCGTCGAGKTCNSAGTCISSCTPACSGKQCGNDGCGGSCGACTAGKTCNAVGTCVSTCTPICTGKVCGTDGCGGACGTCAAGQSCTAAGQCAAAGCGSVTAAGTCNGTTLTWCKDGALTTKDCKALGNFECKAVTSGFDCVAAAGCTPACNGKTCGADGCGGLCGTCTAGSSCQSGTCVSQDPCAGLTFTGCCDGSVLNWCEAGAKKAQSCGDFGCGWNAQAAYYDCGYAGDGPANAPKACGGTACTPSCSGKVCGDDGCGGICGICTDGTVCAEGACMNGCGDVSFEGACDGTSLLFCNAGELQGGNCTDVQGSGCCGFEPNEQLYTCLPANACSTCVPECELGAGGCSAEATHAYTCTPVNGCPKRTYTWCPLGCDTGKGACVPTSSCTPSCSGKACGGDGCGGPCGTCVAGQSCNAAGQCVVGCTANCDDKTCGSDGCGGQCGSCGAGEACIQNACVTSSCNPKCDGKVCGDNGCGGTCGTCAGALTCNKNGACVDKPDTCSPDCDGKACGPDGCDGVCGICGKADLCQDGACVANPVAACGSLPTYGLCQGDTLRFCSATGPSEIDCAAQGLACVATSSKADCVTPGSCLPDCTGRACGDDGCGGSCGGCSKDDACIDGTCVIDGCVPACTGKSCSSDGCGGSCGTCEDGASCSAAGVCGGTTPACEDGQTRVDGECTDVTDGVTTSSGGSRGGCTTSHVPTADRSGPVAVFTLGLVMLWRLRRQRRQSD